MDIGYTPDASSDSGSTNSYHSNSPPRSPGGTLSNKFVNRRKSSDNNSHSDY